MRLSTLRELDSFALLGPGFCGSDCGLMRGLDAGDPGSVGLVYTPFEGRGRSAASWGARSWERIELEVDVTPQPFATQLDTGAFVLSVETIREAIARGDVYQVCLSTVASIAPRDGAELFAAMNGRGMARFAAWVRFPDGVEIVSASPELFFAVEGRRVCTEPMKGTAPADRGLELMASAKDAAELAMITDLLRNDLTPVCEPLSVVVSCPRRLVELSYAVQTVSDIEGRLLPDTSVPEVLEALHPGGSVVGAPKKAALEMIRQLEPQPRGAHCGTLGVLRPDHSVFSLLIRTAERRGEDWRYGVGCGIVYDSEAQREVAELGAKLGALACTPPCA